MISDYLRVISNIHDITAKYIGENNIQSLVLGVSGGIDSALVAALMYPLCESLDIPLIGRSIPIETNTLEEQHRANAIGEHFCQDFRVLDLSDDYQDYMAKKSLRNPQIMNDDVFKVKIRRGNIKARFRMIELYDIAQENHGTFNR